MKKCTCLVAVVSSVEHLDVFDLFERRRSASAAGSRVDALVLAATRRNNGKAFRRRVRTIVIVIVWEVGVVDRTRFAVQLPHRVHGGEENLTCK